MHAPSGPAYLHGFWTLTSGAWPSKPFTNWAILPAQAPFSSGVSLWLGCQHNASLVTCAGMCSFLYYLLSFRGISALRVELNAIGLSWHVWGPGPLPSSAHKHAGCSVSVDSWEDPVTWPAGPRRFFVRRLLITTLVRYWSFRCPDPFHVCPAKLFLWEFTHFLRVI